MKNAPQTNLPGTPLLIPMEPAHFWQQIRNIIREEITAANTAVETPIFETPGLTYKPLYKIAELCGLFQVSKPTIYDWIKHGKLKPFKIRSRVYFLAQDVQYLLRNEDKT